MPFLSSRCSLFIVLIIFMTMLVPGCVSKMPPEPQWEMDANSLLNQAESYYSLRNYDQAVKTVNTFFAKYPQSRHRDRAFYLLGDIKLMQRDYRQGLGYFKQIIQEFPSSAYIADAKYKLGVCYYELKEYELAVANLQDRSKITDSARLKRISDILSVSYGIQKKYPLAIKELLYLSAQAQNEHQRTGYKDRIREIVEKNLTEQELAAYERETEYPADIAQLRLAALLFEQRKYRDSISVAKNFLSRFPNHPERTKVEMIINEATVRLQSPKFAIGALVPRSGNIALFGDPVLKGIQLAVHTYNQKEPEARVELIVKDTQGIPEKAVQALTELGTQSVIAAVGPLLTKEAEAIAPLLEKVKIPVITPAASGEGIGKLSPWLFRNALTTSSQAAAAVQYAVEQRLRKFVILYQEDAYGKDLARLFTKQLERRGEILASISYPSDVKDFGPYIRRIIEIDLRSQRIAIPEDAQERKKLFQNFTPSFHAIYLPGHAEKIGLLIPQLAYYNIKDIVMIGSNDWHSQDLIDRAERHAEGALFTDGFFPESTDPAIKSMVDAYRSAYQETPDILAAQSYDATMMILSLLKQQKETPQAIRDGLLATKDYPGISGLTTFSGSGEAQKKLFFIRIQNGKFVSNTETR
ncbi:MAG: penicillin-binding protein activator [Nitrospirota bacterium]